MKRNRAARPYQTYHFRHNLVGAGNVDQHETSRREIEGPFRKTGSSTVPVHDFDVPETMFGNEFPSEDV